ncbi:PhoH family protein [Gulosibacter sp. ACHW.36C]|uniref:PhoH-like protein n=1 Tax=Gulosibacter sediminis TaxID=1729695 RepID=A0ABY4N4E3_9MICO|nr:PhoH family protein [Gulosibacter sediminis]UQN16093.1 PhoH family protein [Gulosibacter sediminis]
MLHLLGPGDRLLSTIEAEHPNVTVLVRGNEVHLRGDVDDVELAERLVREMASLAGSGAVLAPDEVARSKQLLSNGAGPSPTQIFGEAIVNARGRAVRPKTLGQKRYVDAIDVNTVTFGIGPAGTGKTYLAMAKAVQALQRNEINKIVLTRPAVEAGERLGFLPGTLNDKIDPYLRPLFDALGDMLDPDLVVKLMSQNVVEVAPLAYMRGRTLNDAYVILDEAQNTTQEQMKMFLTRLGFGSKLVVTGDVTQVDLPGGNSGLRHASRVLRDIPDIHFAELTSDDVVRHSLVAKIVDAYDEYTSRQEQSR